MLDEYNYMCTRNNNFSNRSQKVCTLNKRSYPSVLGELIMFRLSCEVCSTQDLLPCVTLMCHANSFNFRALWLFPLATWILQLTFPSESLECIGGCTLDCKLSVKFSWLNVWFNSKIHTPCTSNSKQVNHWIVRMLTFEAYSTVKIVFIQRNFQNKFAIRV